MRDSRRIQERMELRLDRLQLVWLTLGVMVALAFSFTLGLVMGKRTARLEDPAQTTNNPIAQIDADGEMHKKLTFYDKLTAREAEPLPPPMAKAPTPPVATAPSKPATPALTTTAVAVPSNALASAPPSVESTPTASDSTPVSPAASSDARELSAAEQAAAVGLTRGPAASGVYTVQVSAFQTMAEAKAFTAAMNRKGYQPFIVSSQLPGKGTWYRVRLGSFVDERSAQEAKKILARDDIAAWVLKSE